MSAHSLFDDSDTSFYSWNVTGSSTSVDFHAQTLQVWLQLSDCSLHSLMINCTLKLREERVAISMSMQFLTASAVRIDFPDIDLSSVTPSVRSSSWLTATTIATLIDEHCINGECLLLMYDRHP